MKESINLMLSPRPLVSKRFCHQHCVRLTVWFTWKYAIRSTLTLDCVIPVIAIGLKILWWFLVVFILNIVSKKWEQIDVRVVGGRECSVMAGDWGKLVLLRSYWASNQPRPSFSLTLPLPPDHHPHPHTLNVPPAHLAVKYCDGQIVSNAWSGWLVLVVRRE